MRVDPSQGMLDARIGASSVEDRVRWLMTMRAAAMQSVWQQADAAGVADPVEQAEFLLRRLYPEESEAWFAGVLEKLRAARAAGTWSGFERPDA